MTIKVINREDSNIEIIYNNVEKVTDCFTDNGVFAHRIHIGEETATFPACEWQFYKLDFVRMFF